MKSKSLILLVLSIGFGIVAAIGISQVMKSQAIADPVEAPRGPVLLASTDLGLHEKLTEENVTLENWPIDTIPEGAVTTLEEITDMVTKTRMSPGIPIVHNAIQHKNISFSPPIPKGMKVVAVRVAAHDTIGNLLRPGNKVDVIGVFKQRNPVTNQRTTNSRTFLKALEVYSIGNKTEIDPSEKGPNQNASSIVGLLVTQKQSEALVFVQDTGSIKLVLRGDDVENNGDVGHLQDLQEELANSESQQVNSENRDYKPEAVSMVIIRGNETTTYEIDKQGAHASGNTGGETEGSGSRELNEGEYTDSADRGSSNRGIDDDQYRGE